jgi:hypothetical protein
MNSLFGRRCFTLYIDDSLVALGLLDRYEGMNFAETRVCYRNHTCGRIEFHGAAPKRDHPMYQGKIFRLKMVHISQHFRFRVVGVKHGMFKILALPHEGLVETNTESRAVRGIFTQDIRQRDFLLRHGGCEHVDNVDEIIRETLSSSVTPTCSSSTRRRLIRRAEAAWWTAPTSSARMVSVSKKEFSFVTMYPSFFHLIREHLSEKVYLCCDRLDSHWTVIYCIHGCHVCQKSLCSANVGCGLLPTNVLLAGCGRGSQTDQLAESSENGTNFEGPADKQAHPSVPTKSN